ncbi:MAG: hypothetical protein JWN34_5433, partial [Bryobacterales bacterium]|nr:hypothetical protein [Bryobacterales bacterium]
TRRSRVARSASVEWLRPSFRIRERTKASTGDFVHARSAGVAKDGTAGVVRGRKDQWRRSAAVYFPSGARVCGAGFSAAVQSRAAATPTARAAAGFRIVVGFILSLKSGLGQSCSPTHAASRRTHIRATSPDNSGGARRFAGAPAESLPRGPCVRKSRIRPKDLNVTMATVE